MSNELATIDETPNHLIALALDKQANPDTIAKLMDLQERWEANKAHKAFVAAMSVFKQESPAVLKKNDVVDFSSSKGRTHYKYANLGSIVLEITAILGKHLLSASWSTDQHGKDVTVTCHITHVDGHRESTTLTGPIDESGNKNPIQAIGSAVTYLQRYTLLAALGLATGEDDDGRGGVAPPAGTTSQPATQTTTDNHGNPNVYPCPDCQAAGRNGVLLPPTGKGPWKCSLKKEQSSGKFDEKGKEIWVDIGECTYKSWDAPDIRDGKKELQDLISQKMNELDLTSDALRQICIDVTKKQIPEGTDPFEKFLPSRTKEVLQDIYSALVKMQEQQRDKYDEKYGTLSEGDLDVFGDQ